MIWEGGDRSIDRLFWVYIPRKRDGSRYSHAIDADKNNEIIKKDTPLSSVLLLHPPIAPDPSPHRRRRRK